LRWTRNSNGHGRNSAWLDSFHLVWVIRLPVRPGSFQPTPQPLAILQHTLAFAICLDVWSDGGNTKHEAGVQHMTPPGCHQALIERCSGPPGLHRELAAILKDQRPSGHWTPAGPQPLDDALVNKYAKTDVKK